jgi:hypothetical protein
MIRLLPIAALVVVVLLALTAGWAYAVVAVLVAVAIVGGAAAGTRLARRGRVPFASDASTPLGDSSEHSSVSSARRSPRAHG